MRKWQSLNPRQLEVLRRVSSGEDLSGDSAAKVSAGALHDRGLVVVNRRGGGWRAAITDAGRFYLEHGRHPDRPDSANSAKATVDSGLASNGPTSRAAKRLPPHTTARIAAERRAAAAELVDKLVAKKRV